MRNFGYDLSLIVKTFGIEVARQTDLLAEWTSARYELDTIEQANFDALFADAEEDGGYWNEEELKINFVGVAFRLAKVNVKDRIKVFYERPLSATIAEHSLAVIAGCLIAVPLPFNTPSNPYFFLQELKKRKGDKHDRYVGPPEAQMLTAMLIAQEINQDDKPVFGGYLIGQNWNFAILDGRTYCQSRQYDAARRDELLQIIFTLRKLRELLLGR